MSETLGARLRNLLTPYKNLLALAKSGNANDETIKKFGLDNLEELIAFSKSEEMDNSNKRIELTKEVAMALLKGVVPNYEVMDKIPRDLGYYVGGMREGWDWVFSSLFPENVKYSAEELYEFYLLCRDSWKK